MMASKRVNVKAILADADLRRKLMVSTIQATQAREGIDTSPEQADRAYSVVTEAARATFKACTKCSVLKDLSGFNVDRTKKDGFHSICKVCHSVHNKNKRLTNSIWVEQARLKSKLWREIYPERSRETIINATYKKKYGISLSEYNATLEHQNYVCAICNQPENHIDKRRGKVKRLAVDHSHSTGKVRGLLCQGCNVSLGKMKDSPTLLRAAANYLEDRDRQ